MARKLHEFLGSQSQVVTQAEKTRGDLATLFDKKRHHFGEKIITYKPDAEGAPAVVESQSSLQTTVAQELGWIAPLLARAMDSEATIDEGNMLARGSVKLDNGEVLLENVPATQLLQLDKRLNELMQLIQGIPTLDPTGGFKLDPDRGAGVYVAREITKRRTKKEQVALQLTPTTKEHPGTAQLITKDVETGTIREQEWSGLITPATKAEMIGRVEELRRQVKQARSRANDIEVQEVKIGQKLLEYVFAPVKADEKSV